MTSLPSYAGTPSCGQKLFPRQCSWQGPRTAEVQLVTAGWPYVQLAAASAGCQVANMATLPRRTPTRVHEESMRCRRDLLVLRPREKMSRLVLVASFSRPGQRLCELRAGFATARRVVYSAAGGGVRLRIWGLSRACDTHWVQLALACGALRLTRRSLCLPTSSGCHLGPDSPDCGLVGRTSADVTRVPVLCTHVLVLIY